MIRNLFTVFALLLLVSRANAGLVYQVSFDATGATLSSNANLTVGGPAGVFNIYLHEMSDGVGGFTPRIDLPGGTNGLTTANFAINRTAGSTTDITGANGNVLFDFGVPSPNFTVSNATVEQEALTSPVFASSSAADRRTVLLGSVQLSAQAIGVTTFSLADFKIGNNDFVIDDLVGGLNFVADNSISFGTLTITAVPEPSSLFLVSVVGVVAVLRRRR